MFGSSSVSKVRELQVKSRTKPPKMVEKMVDMTRFEVLGNPVLMIKPYMKKESPVTSVVVTEWKVRTAHGPVWYKDTITGLFSIANPYERIDACFKNLSLCYLDLDLLPILLYTSQR